MAGILDRISTIARANINDLLDKTQNPEAELNYFIQQMADGIKEADKAVTASVSQQKLLQINAEQSRKQAHDWEVRSEKAVSAGRDDLATEAIRQQNKFEQEAATYDSQYQEQKGLADKLRGQLDTLRQKFRETETNKINLIARYRMAKTAQKVSGVRDPGTGLNEGGYSRMERKIMSEEARATMDEVPGAVAQAEIDALPGDTGIEAELAALKARLNPPPTQPDSENK